MATISHRTEIGNLEIFQKIYKTDREIGKGLFSGIYRQKMKIILSKKMVIKPKTKKKIHQET